MISDPDKRSFSEKEAVNSNRSVRERKRQIDRFLFERLLLSRGDANKEQVLCTRRKGPAKGFTACRDAALSPGGHAETQNTVFLANGRWSMYNRSGFSGGKAPVFRADDAVSPEKATIP